MALILWKQIADAIMTNINYAPNNLTDKINMEVYPYAIELILNSLTEITDVSPDSKKK